MKYLYKQTGIIVESSNKLDSMFFAPIPDEREPQNEDADVDQREEVKEPIKKAAKRTVKK